VITTAAVTKRVGRQFITIDIEDRFVSLAEEEVRNAVPAGEAPRAKFQLRTKSRVPYNGKVTAIGFEVVPAR
jgi:hypothetical protein